MQAGVLTQCQSASSIKSTSNYEAPALARSGNSGSPDSSEEVGTIPKVGRLTRREASQRITVISVTTAQSECTQLIASHGGRIEESQRSKDGDISANFVARIPAEKLEMAMDDLAKLGKETQRSVRTEDVTVEYSDLEAKLKSQRLLRQRLQALLANAGQVKDLLEVEKELARVQQEIDSAAAAFERLRSEILLSKLSISLNSRELPGPGGLAWMSLKWALRKVFVLG